MGLRARMGSQTHIGPRERQILTAIVETYISTGEPVGSRTLAQTNREGLSPASIRNVMADLADAGFLDQPHTSAGRVPTPHAFRYYVEQISGKAQLSSEDQNRISGLFEGANDVQEFLERTSRVLSLVSSGVGVATLSGSGKKNALDHVHFSWLPGQRVLAVIVTSGGVVRDRVLRVERELTQLDLDTASRYINDNFRGWTVKDIQAEIAKRIQQERSEYDRLMTSIEELYQRGALQHAEPERDVYVEGVSNLVASNQDSARLKELLRTLEEKKRVAELLSAYLDARQEAVRVVIGLEDAAPEMRNLVLIGAPARVGDEVMGSVAVIGPTRMDYEHTLPAVSYIAQLFDRILNQED